MNDHDAAIGHAKRMIVMYGKNSAQGKAWGAYLADLSVIPPPTPVVPIPVPPASPPPPPVPIPPAPAPSGSYLNTATAHWTPVARPLVKDPQSDRLVAQIAAVGLARVLLLGVYSLVIAEAPPGTPTVQIGKVRLEDWWGKTNLPGTIPWPGALPNASSDGKLTVLDRAGGRIIDLSNVFLSSPPSGVIEVGFGAVYPLGGDGISTAPAHHGVRAVPENVPLQKGNGAALPSIYGCLRVEEARQAITARKAVPHVLTFASYLGAGDPEYGPFRLPATTTDGKGPADGIPYGARFVLDMSEAEIATFVPYSQNRPETNEFTRMLMRTVAAHGMMLVDYGGVAVGLNCESDRQGGRVWRSLGAEYWWDHHPGDPTADWTPDGFPWDRLVMVA